MSQIEGVINQNFKNAISQKFPNRSFHVIHQNDRIFILHIAALSVFMAIFLIPNFVQEQCARAQFMHVNWLQNQQMHHQDW